MLYMLIKKFFHVTFTVYAHYLVKSRNKPRAINLQLTKTHFCLKTRISSIWNNCIQTQVSQ